MHSRNDIIYRRSVWWSQKKGLVDIEGFCVYQVAQARNSTVCGVVVCGPYDPGVSLRANPYVVKCSNSGIKPETKPVRAQDLSCILFYRSPFLPYKENVGYFPFPEVATAPKTGTIRCFYDCNEVSDIHKAVEQFAHVAVVGLPVRKEVGSQGTAAICILRNIMQKFVLVISAITQRAWWRVRLALMGENLIVERSVISHDNHRLSATGAARTWSGSTVTMWIQFWAKFRRIRLDGDLFFDVVRVKRCFHGSNSFFMYPDVEIQRYKRLESPAIFLPEAACSLA